MENRSITRPIFNNGRSIQYRTGFIEYKDLEDEALSKGVCELLGFDSESGNDLLRLVIGFGGKIAVAQALPISQHRFLVEAVAWQESELRTGECHNILYESGNCPQELGSYLFGILNDDDSVEAITQPRLRNLSQAGLSTHFDR